RLTDESRRLDELAHHGLALRSTIDLTYRTLNSQSARLFRLFSLMHGSDFPPWTAAALLDVDVIDAEELLDTLVDVELLDTVQAPNSPALRSRFHAWTRVYAREQAMATESDEDRRAALSRVLGAWLGQAELAHRLEYGGDFTILHGSADRWQPHRSTR